MPARKRALAHGRPPSFNKPQATLSSKATRTLIRTHHRLQKEHAKAVETRDDARAAEIQKRIDEHGGLKSYQAASITGQSSERGGDSSKVLMDWLNEELEDLRSKPEQHPPYDMLEVGALSTMNACSKASYLRVKRIDLHSQHPEIETQDFMERPAPASDKEMFDIISLSLVLNYVSDAVGRGAMLQHTTQFLRQRNDVNIFPALFLVLPAPCVSNSRYLDETRLKAIMGSLRYSLLRRKISTKLVYYLWKYKKNDFKPSQTFHKKEISPGKAKNNFCIVLQ